MMKKVLIIHAWDSSPEEHWYKEEEKALRSMGFEVFVPKMPGGLWPKKVEWVNIIQDLKPDEETILIGHSLGVPAILRYLEIAKVSVAQTFLIAGFASDLGIEETKNFVDNPFDWKAIGHNTKEVFVINESDDPYVPIKYGREIAESLEAEFIEVPGNIHFDQMDLDLINSRIT